MMRLLCLIDSLKGQGAERSLAELVQCYSARGVEVAVVHIEEKGDLHDELRSYGASVMWLGPGNRARLARRLKKIIERRSPAIVHTTLFNAHVVGRIAALASRTPVVSTWTSELYGPDHVHHPAFSKTKVRVAQLADSLTARSVRRFHAVARHVAVPMARRLGVGLDRVDIIPRGRRRSALGLRTAERKRRVRASLGIAGTDRVILAAARHDRRKGLDVLLEAFGAIKRTEAGARLLVAGSSGPETARLTTHVASMPWASSVQFLGFRPDVPDLMVAADVFVLPSRSEGFPGALLEAMALEAPVVATDIPGVREVLGSTMGALLVAPGQPTPMAEAVAAALRGPPMDIVRAARQRFDACFTSEAVADQMLAFYERALGR